MKDNKSGKRCDNNDDLSKIEGEKKPIKLYSPAGNEPLIFHFNQPECNHLIALDILDIIRVIMNEYLEIDTAIQNICKLEDLDVNNYFAIRSLSKKFNKAIINMLNKNGPPDKQLMSKELLRQVVTRCYNKAVDNEKALNKHYEAFSSQTYGETSYDRMQMILDEIQPSEDDVFVDLGSGVGQLVVHVAGATKVKQALGVEIAQLPSRFANSLEIEFKKWMSWYGKYCSPFKLERGDFLNEKYRDIITQDATIIFINNYAFQSDLEMRIKMELLRELKDGTRIISTKPYVPLNKGAITDRQLNDISVIIDITELRQCPNPCSWTSNYVPYYMHVINRAKLERYFFNRNPSLRGRSNDGARRSMTPSSKTSNSRESSVGLKDNYKNGLSKQTNNGTDEFGFGPTTRRKWQDYVSELEQQKKKKSGTEDVEIFKEDEIKSSSKDDFQFFPVKCNKDESINSNDVPPEKKIKRSYDKKKDKINRGRPKKSDPSFNKNNVMSEDAKEGIELMHQMTKAVSSGNNADLSFFLADLKSKRVNIIDKHNFHDPNLPSTSTCDVLQPLLSVSESNVLNYNSIGSSPNKKIKFDKPSKYLNLENFLTELRYLYENFLDSMHTPKFVQKLVDKINYEKTQNELYINVDPLENNDTKKEPTFSTKIELLEKIKEFGVMKDNSDKPEFHFAERTKSLIETNRRICAKRKELDTEISNFNNAMEQLLLDYQQHYEKLVHKEESEQQQRKDQENRELQEQLLLRQQRQQQQQQHEDLLTNLARQQLFQQQKQNPQTQLQSLFPPAINQLVMSDIAHHYSQQAINTNPLLTQLSNLLNASSVNNSSVNADLSTLKALQAVAAATNNVNNSNINSAISALSPVGSLHQSPNMAAAIAVLSPPTQNLVSQQTQPQSQQLMQNFLNSIDLNSLPTNASNNIGFAGNSSNTSNSVTSNIDLRSPKQKATTTPDSLNNNNLHHIFAQQPALSNNKIIDPSSVSFSNTSVAQSTSTISVNSAIVSSSSSLNSSSTLSNNFDEQSTVAAVVAAVAAGGAKKLRNRGLKTPNASKRNFQGTKEPEDPVKQEEIERQIQVIVAKALEVDSAAKYAEKERKARTGEKRNKDKFSNASTLIPAPNFAGTSATVIANYASNNNVNKKYNSQELILSPTSSLTANSSLGSAPGSAISSPTISTKVVNYQQTFLPSTANACTQLLSANISTPLSKTISITSVAPPPHSPSPNLVPDSASSFLNSNSIQENCSNLSKKLKNKLNETNYISSSGSFIQPNFIQETSLSDSISKTDKDSMKHISGGYIPLSSRTVMENLQLATSYSTTTYSKAFLNDPGFSKRSSTIKLERQTPDSNDNI